jgi:type IV/VI secretion system ImpK/VasF family protein
MKNKLWEAVYSVFREVEAEGSGQLEVERLIALRKRLRLKLDILRSSLTSQGDHQLLNDREIYYVLFPIVIFLDEILQAKVLPGERVEYLRLQKELFDIDVGGNAFYEVLDDLLRKPNTYPFIFEVFYFCLSSGFLGRHKGDIVEQQRYKEKLGRHIVYPKLEPIALDQVEIKPIKFESFPYWYYITVILAVSCVYIALKLIAPIPDFADWIADLLS